MTGEAREGTRLTVPVTSQIEELVRDVPGWTPLDQLYTLFTLAFATSHLPGDLVEVGSWCGRSAVVLGLAAQLAGRSRVLCADLFPERRDWSQNPDGTYSFEVTIEGKRYGGSRGGTIWKEVFETQFARVYERHPAVLDWFRETVAARGLEDVVLAHRGDLASLLVAAGPGFRCRLAFLDGDHGHEQVCADLAAVEAHLVPGGWICFDDAFTTYEGVSRAIREQVLQSPRWERGQQMTRKLFVARRTAAP